MIEARQIRVAFAGVEVLKGVDIVLHAGEVHAIVGENGAGKSTLGKVCAGVHRPSAGSLSIGGEAVSFSNPREAMNRGIALIHQEPLTFPDLSVTENIFVGRLPVSGPLRKVNWVEAYRRAQEILTSIGVALDPRSKVRGLPIADQQMVELAAALSQDAKVLILDETTAALTPKEVEDLFVIVRRLRDAGCAIAFVSHRLDEVFDISNRITILRDGEKVGERMTKETDRKEIVKLMVGREVESVGFPPGREPGEPLLELSRLSRKGEFEDINLVIRAGEIVALAGLVGAGRTEIARAVFGVTQADSGSITLDGQPYQAKNPRDAIARGLALVPEDRQHDGLLLPITIEGNASMVVLKQLAKSGWVNRTKERESSEKELAKMRIAMRSVTQQVRELSGGNQQKVVLAKWLLSQPKVLILDEPTRGIDIGAKVEVHRLMRELADAGMGILMISSDLPEVLAMSDRILVMKRGRITGEFAHDAATAELVMGAATG